MLKSGFLFFSTLFLAYALWNCANQTTPMGGPKDTIPPVLIKSIPEHKQKNFDGKSIELTFSEFINPFNPKDEILISPSIGKDIDFKAKKNSMTITPKNDWAENTTYTVSIREGVKDITENNPPVNLRLAFSTGPYIDSLSIKGKVRYALNEKIPEKITVAIYESDTFDIFNHTPEYFTIINKQGQFSLENLKHGSYHIYAFDDKNKNLKVESRTEDFGFLSQVIEPEKTDSLSIYLVRLDTRTPKLNSNRTNGLYTRLSFNKMIDKYSVSFPGGQNPVHSYGSNQSEVVIYNPEFDQDSISFHAIAFDSLQQSVDTTLYIKKISNKFIKDDFTIKPGKISYNLKTDEISQNYQLSKPLKELTIDSIYIEADSAYRIPIFKENFAYDSITKTLKLTQKIPRDTLFRNDKYRTTLYFKPSGLISIENDSSKSFSTGLTEVKPNQTGTLYISISTEVPNYIVMLTNTAGEIIEEVSNPKNYGFQYLPAQNYRIKILIDSNNNGRWDAGNIFENVEPEKYIYYKTAENKSDIPIRANWELGPLLLKF